MFDSHAKPVTIVAVELKQQTAWLYFVFRYYKIYINYTILPIILVLSSLFLLTSHSCTVGLYAFRR